MYFFTPRRCETSQKIMYSNKGQALIAADKSWRERGTQLWVYQCDDCHGWHLTHRDPSERMIYSVARSYNRKPRSRKRGYKPRQR